MTLPPRADVVVIGGGVIGAATLYYLAALGCTDAVLLERETLAAGSTGHCAGGVRTLFSDELNVRICDESIRRLERFPDELGEELDLRLWGYLFLLDEKGDAAAFTDAVALQNTLGIPSKMLSPEQAAERVPQLDVAGLVAAAFDPRAGYVTPETVVHAYVRAAARLGATVVQSCAATRITPDGVETAQGTIATERVVLAAGVWSRELLDLPVTPERRWMFFTEDAPDFPLELPLTIDFSTGFYFHREGAALALGGRAVTIEELAPDATRRVPALADLGIRSSWWGWYEMSPDHNALVGERDGIVFATGFSGHGFQQGPVIGEHLAQLALGMPPTFDLSVFSPDRFAAGAARVERNVV